MIISLFLGFALGAVIGGLAWRAGALTRSGAAAAALTGGLVFGLGGLPWALLLIGFFVSSSVLSRLFSRRKRPLNAAFAKSARRDWAQVAANGGLGVLLAAAHALWPQAAWPWLAFAGAMAAVNADTWATELGVLNPSPPRRFLTFQPVERGASGGVSPAGTLAAAAGAGFIALLGWAVSGGPLLPWAAVALAGLLGSLFDSLLGATVQAVYTCPACGKETERHPLHTCGSPTRRVRGWPWLNNDLVNFAASACGAAAALLLLGAG